MLLDPLFSRIQCELISAHTGQAGMLSNPGPSAVVGLAGLALSAGAADEHKQRTEVHPSRFASLLPVL